MEDLKDRIAPEPPNTVNFLSGWDHFAALEAYNLKYNPQIDWKEFEKELPEIGSDIYYRKKPSGMIHKWESFDDFGTTGKEYCYAKEYEEAEAIKKAIRPFGEFTEVTDERQGCRTWNKGGLSIEYYETSEQFVLFDDDEFVLCVRESDAEKTIKSVLDIEK